MCRTPVQIHEFKTTDRHPQCGYRASEIKTCFAIRSLITALIATVLLFPIAGFPQNLDDAVSRQLEINPMGDNFACERLLNGNPAEISFLKGGLSSICSRPVVTPGTGPANSIGGGATTPSTLPSIVQQRLRENSNEKNKPDTKTPAASAGTVAQIGGRLNLFFSGESSDRNRIASSFKNDHDFDIRHLTDGEGYNDTDRVVPRSEDNLPKIAKASYPGLSNPLTPQQYDSLAILQAQPVSGASSETMNRKVATFELAMGPLRVTGVEIQEATANSAIIRIQTDQAVVNYKTFLLSDPPRIVIDIAGALMAESMSRKKAGEGPIKQIRSSQYRRKPEPLVRVVLDLASHLPYQVAGLPDTFQLFIGEAVTEADPVKLLVPPPATAEKPKPAPEELTIATEPGQTFQPSVGLWGVGEYEDLDRDRTSFEDGYDSDIWRVTVGADYQFTDWIFAGLAFDYFQQDGDFDSGGGFDIKSLGLIGFGSILPTDKTFIQFYGGYAQNDYDRKRNATFSQLSGVFFSRSGSPDADYDADQYSAGILGGYDFPIRNFTIGPRVGLDWIYRDFETYSEKGNSGLELTFHDDDQTLLQTRVGVQTLISFSTDFGLVAPQVSFDWKHEFDNDQRTVEVSFVDDMRAQRFNYRTDEPDRDWFEINAGVVFAFIPHGMQAFVNYRTLMGQDYYDSHAGTIGLRYSF